ncbi:MAG: hypothetical protein ACXW1W_00975 [Methylococcaceae bacterium]
MPEFENNKNAQDDFLNFDFTSHLMKNKRIATRYIRKDIIASVNNIGFFSSDKDIPVELVDIASKGALIWTTKKLDIKKKITLNLTFKTGKTFVIKARFVYKLGKTVYRYGIKFDSYNNELGDYLLETQSKLVLK